VFERIPVTSFPKGGHFMSEEEERNAGALIFLKYNEKKKHLERLRETACEIAKELEALAKLLKTRPEATVFEGENVPLAEYRKLGSLVSDIRDTIEELQRLAPTISKLGLE
jgi:tRNA U34 5-methylaminomethyl-2-thiouridine-forming methyltransferase MnmC